MSFWTRFQGPGFMGRCFFMAGAALYGAGHSVWVDHEPWLSVAAWVTVSVAFVAVGWWRR